MTLGDERELMPSGLTRSEFAVLNEYAFRADSVTVEQLRKKVDRHLEQTQTAHSRNRLVNLRLATALTTISHQILEQWETIAESSRSWLGGAILYFAESNDEEPDFTSALGFEDDANIMNACLRYAGLQDLCINTEDYDHA